MFTVRESVICALIIGADRAVLRRGEPGQLGVLGARADPGSARTGPPNGLNKHKATIR